MTDHDLPLRQAVRALMIDPHDRVALIKLDVAHNDWVGWVLPGGGIEKGEEPADALRRELLEETGLADAFVGPVVARRTVIGPSIAVGFGGQCNTIHLVPCRSFELTPAHSEHQLRDEGIMDMGWFSVDEVRAMTEVVVPEALADLVDRVLEFGGSIEPLEFEVHN